MRYLTTTCWLLYDRTRPLICWSLLVLLTKQLIPARFLATGAIENTCSYLSLGHKANQMREAHELRQMEGEGGGA